MRRSQKVAGHGPKNVHTGLSAASTGRGEELPALPPGASPTRLPASGITADDLRGVRFQLVVRGYKMSEVDWVLRRARRGSPTRSSPGSGARR